MHIFTGRDEHLNVAIALRDSAKKEILQIAPSFIGTFATKFALKKVLQRGVKYKVIIRNITKENRDNIRVCLKHNADIREYYFKDPLSLIIKDSEEMIFGAHEHKDKQERLMLLTRNQALINSLQNTFNEWWKKAKPVKKV